MIRVRCAQPFPVKEWMHMTLTYDGSSRAAGTALYINGAPSRSRSSATPDAQIMPYGGGALGDESVGLAFGKRFRKTPVKDGGIDEVRVFKRALTPLEVALPRTQVKPPASGEVARPRRWRRCSWPTDASDASRRRARR